MKRRIELIKYTLLKRTLGGPLKNWLLNCLGPTCSMLAKHCIEGMTLVGDYQKVKLKNVDDHLFFKQTLSLRSLYQTIAEQFYDWQWHYYQIPQTTVEADDVVFDCGCAEGIFTFLNRHSAKHIYAFEPLPEYVEGLEQTFKDADNVSIVNYALGAEPGTAYLKQCGIASTITAEKTDLKIKISTIDDFCETSGIQPTYIKADLEGYEMNLLSGAANTIRTCKPKIAITTYHIESHARDIADYLMGLNPAYTIKVKGIEERHGAPVMLHAW